ncbi:MAG: bifunctional folylpolyglutamate synthase/dihydrofolate synthase [Thermoanaerobaculum sp.]
MPHPPELLELDRLLAGRWETRVVPGLERITRVLARLGNPETRYPSVLVLGTNGKGSTAAFLASLLQAMGLRVGLYTSPHLVRVEERIRINGEPLDSAELLSWAKRLGRFSELSYFETLTAAAFGAFAENHVDVAVVEAGLGGRWDATNAKQHDVALLTNVGTDHQQWLGPTRASIAAEKAAAMRGREGILGVWDEELVPTIRAHAGPKTRLTPASHWVVVETLPAPAGTLAASVRARAFGTEWEAQLPLHGRYQIENYRLALAGLAALCHHHFVPEPTADTLLRGTAATRWPGRLELVSWKGRRFLLDGAHNAEAVTALAGQLAAAGLSGTLDLVFACLADKPLATMASLLRPLVDHVQVVPLASPRARAVTQLAAAFPGCSVAESVAAALQHARLGRITLVTGSLRLVGEALAVLRGRA